MVKDKLNGNETIPVPCGKCPECAKRRASGWSFRLMQQEKISKSAHFITLTYDTKYLPLSDRGYMSLDRRDLQLFLKRLRQAQIRGGDSTYSSLQIRYYAVGEYGGKTNRPHYHFIIFNADISLMQKVWDKGAIHYGTVTGASIGYTLKYLSKRSKVPQFEGDDREPERALMSKGLGACYLTEQMTEWHLVNQVQTERMYCNTVQNQKITMPRYYKNKIYPEELRKAIGAKARINAEEELQKNLAKDANYYSNKFQSDKQKFKKMDKNATKGDKI